MDEDRRGAVRYRLTRYIERVGLMLITRAISVDGRRERERGGEGGSGTLPPSNLFSRVGCYARDTYIAPGRQCRLIDIARRGFNT